MSTAPAGEPLSEQARGCDNTTTMRRYLIMFCLLATFASCSTSTAPPGTITDDQFVAAMVALRQAALAAGPDEAAYAAARDRILAEQGLTADDLASYLTAHSDDLPHLADVWEAINEQSIDPAVH